MSDGRTVTGFGNNMTAMKDKNGNAITLTNTYDTTNPSILTQTTLSSATQSIAIHWDPSMAQDTVSQTGADGTSLEWKPTWINVSAASTLTYQ